jgi:uncharacterized membrane protein YjfL (UPF0719 family)
MKMLDKWIGRGKALVDGSAWLMILPFLFLMWYIDPIETKTKLLFLLQLPVIVGVALMLARVAVPALSITELMREVRAGNVAAGVTLLGLLVFVGLVVMTAAGWTK